jgi:hypothetical protein
MRYCYQESGQTTIMKKRSIFQSHLEDPIFGARDGSHGLSAPQESMRIAAEGSLSSNQAPTFNSASG